MEAGIICARRGRLCVLEMAAGQQLKVLSGRIWLTEQGRPRDFVLQAGDTHRTLATGRVLIDAEQLALLETCAHEAATPRTEALYTLAQSGSDT